MFPSGVSAVNTAAFTDNDFNTSLGIQDLYSSSSSLFHSSSPFNYIYEDEMIYSQHLQDVFCGTKQDMVLTNNISATGNTEISSQIDVNMKEYMCGGSTNQPVAKKKMSKKDRHSKIITAHGPRDRRIRLSLAVAQKFFGLQDMLGFNKASETVQWLFEHSKNAIKELTERLPRTDEGSSLGTASATSTSDCDVVPGIDEPTPRTTSPKTAVPSTSSKKKRIRSVRKPALLPRTKEAREKVRESTRERTNEKRQQQLDQQSASSMNWRSFGTGREEAVGTSHNTGYNYNDRLSVKVEKMQNARKQQPQSQGSREDIISITEPNNHFKTGSCSPYALSKHHQQTNFGNFSRASHFFTDLQFCGLNN